jgi:hypothetical protein
MSAFRLFVGFWLALVGGLSLVEYFFMGERPEPGSFVLVWAVSFLSAGLALLLGRRGRA